MKRWAAPGAVIHQTAPASGEHVQDVVTKLYAAPKEIVQRAKDLIVP